jgi:hypothetical protein
MKKIILFCGIIFCYVAAYLSGLKCFFRSFFHIICPGCGMTHALIALLQLDFKSAFFYHPMIFAMPLVGWYVVKNGKAFSNKWLNIAGLVILGAGFAGTYIVRLFQYF